MIFSMNTLSGVAGAAFSVMAINFVEDRLPVVALMTADAVEFSNDYTARVTGRKVLDCPIVKDSFVGWYRIGATWQEVAISFPDDATPNDSRPTGKQDFGLWRWHDVPSEARQVRMTLQHNCGGNIRLTSVGPFNVTATEG